MRRPQGVEVAGAITTEECHSRLKILYGKTMRVKFNRDVIITSELTNGHKIFNNGRRNKNIVEMNRCRGGGNGGSDRMGNRQLSTIANNDRGGRMKGTWGSKITEVGENVR